MRLFLVVASDVDAYLHKLIPYKVPDVVYVSVKRVTRWSSWLMLRRRLISTGKGFVHYISGGILARQTKVNEVVTGGTLRRRNLDIVSCAIASEMVRLGSPQVIVEIIPVRDISLVQELDTLCEEDQNDT